MSSFLTAPCLGMAEVTASALSHISSLQRGREQTPGMHPPPKTCASLAAGVPPGFGIHGITTKLRGQREEEAERQSVVTKNCHIVRRLFPAEK